MNTKILFHLFMEKYSENNEINKIVGTNFKSIRIQAGLTKDAMAFGLEKSISYILMIERGAANISQKLAKEICDFFEIKISQLYNNKPIKIKPVAKNNRLKIFYEENSNNEKFFIDRRKEYSTAAFIREVLIPENVLDNFITVGEIITISKRDFNRILESQELSRELRRSFKKGILERNDKFKNGTVYEYRNL